MIRVNTWPKALGPFGKDASGSIEGTSEAPVTTRFLGCSEYWPQWHWPLESGSWIPLFWSLFPPSTWPRGLFCIFSKDGFLQEASDPDPILPSGQVCTDPSDGAWLRPHTEPEASLWLTSSIAVGSRESVPFPFWLSMEGKGQDATCDGALDLMVFPIEPVVKTPL